MTAPAPLGSPSNIVREMLTLFLRWRHEKEWRAKMERNWSVEILDEDTDEMLDRVARK